MESILFKRANSSETAARLAGAPEPAARRDGDRRGLTSPPPTPPAPQTDSATERRLKLIIEAAPVGLMITDPTGQVLAANRATLSLLGIERLDAIVGRNIGTLLATAEADSFAALVASVCSGKPGSIAYEVTGGDGRRRTVETFGTPLRRGDGDATAFLGATWDVTERDRTASALAELESKYALVETDRSALVSALDDAQRMAAAYDHDVKAERERNERAVRDTHSRMQASLDEAEHRHAQLAGQWAGERESLATQLRDAEQKLTAVSSELGAERETLRAALESADRQHQAALARAAEERALLDDELLGIRQQQEAALVRQQQEAALVRQRQEAALVGLRAEHDKLAQTIHELTAAQAELASRRAAEQDDSERVLRAERGRCAQLLDEREAWRAALSEILRGSNETAQRLQQLFDLGAGIRLVSSSHEADQVCGADRIDVQAAADAAAQPAEESSWQF